MWTTISSSSRAARLSQSPLLTASLTSRTIRLFSSDVLLLFSRRVSYIIPPRGAVAYSHAGELLLANLLGGCCSHGCLVRIDGAPLPAPVSPMLALLALLAGRHLIRHSVDRRQGVIDLSPEL